MSEAVYAADVCMYIMYAYIERHLGLGVNLLIFHSSFYFDCFSIRHLLPPKAEQFSFSVLGNPGCKAISCLIFK